MIPTWLNMYISNWVGSTTNCLISRFFNSAARELVGWMLHFSIVLFMKEQFLETLKWGWTLKWWYIPNNHGENPTKKWWFWGGNWGYHHLRKHPNGSVFIAILVYLRSPVMKFTSIFNTCWPFFAMVQSFMYWKFNERQRKQIVMKTTWDSTSTILLFTQKSSKGPIVAWRSIGCDFGLQELPP